MVQISLENRSRHRAQVIRLACISGFGVPVPIIASDRFEPFSRELIYHLLRLRRSALVALRLGVGA